MNILAVIQRYHPVIGGTEILAKNFIDYLSNNHQVTVYTTTAKDLNAFWNKNATKISENSPEKYLIRRFDIVTPSD